MKAPAIQFYVKDWKADVDGLTPAAKGAWIQILCTLWLSKTRGRKTLGLDDWGRIIGCPPEGADELLHQIEAQDCADVTFRGARVTVTSRRLYRAWKDKRAAMLRKRKQRLSQGGHAKVTSSSASAVTASAKKPPCSPPAKSAFKAEEAEIPSNLDTPEFRTSWVDWCAYRAKKRNRVSEIAAGRQLTKLARAGPAAAVWAVEHSIANDYQGLFPEKYDGTTKSKSGAQVGKAEGGQFRPGDRVDA